MTATPITVVRGDGIGPEIMEASLRVLEAAGAELDIEEVVAGESLYLSGNKAGIDDNLWESVRRTGILYKAPLTTPQGGGFKSVNVTIRKTLGLFANVRPCRALAPFVATKHPEMDLVIVRENEEDLYGGIEHQQTHEVVQCLKLMSRPGTERICRFAFEYARANGRKRVDCFTKDNIMKRTDGMFRKIFEEIAAEYPDIETGHQIIDIATARLADTPEDFDIIVLPNLYGDILSDVAAQICGSVGLAGSANLGEHASMFEAIHGSAPTIAGQGIANPSGLLMAGVQMLVHIGQGAIGEKIHNAWLRALEDGCRTGDVHGASDADPLGTLDFAQAIIDRLGQEPQHLAPVRYAAEARMEIPPAPRYEPKKRELLGVDVFTFWDAETRDPAVLAGQLKTAEDAGLALEMITNRGQTVWPSGAPETFCTDHWRCRFRDPSGGVIEAPQVFDLLHRLHGAGVDVIKTEHLYAFDGTPAFSVGQGQAAHKSA